VKKNKIKTKKFINYPPPVPAQDIILKDDAFHGSQKRIAAEWWYFDANFSNGYSIHIGVRTVSKKKHGMVVTLLNFYKNGKLFASSKKRFSFNKFKTSSDYPLAILENKKIITINKEEYKENKKWIYEVTLDIDENKVDLTFIGSTKGFKFVTDKESWTVALPKAFVKGEITVNGKKMIVEGIGYHDHNWNYSMLTPLTYGKGWYWGKIMSKTLTVSWAEVIKSKTHGEILAVINKDKQGYFSADAKKIQFTPKQYIYINRRKTPTIFSIKIDDVVNEIPIKVDVKMKAHEIHFNKVLIIAPYCRYHVKAKGYIMLGSYKEEVNDTQIMEFLRFI